MRVWLLLFLLTALAFPQYPALAVESATTTADTSTGADATKKDLITERTGNTLYFKTQAGETKLVEKNSEYCVKQDKVGELTDKEATDAKDELCKQLGKDPSKPDQCSWDKMSTDMIALSHSMGGVPPGSQACASGGYMERATNARLCASEAVKMADVAVAYASDPANNNYTCATAAIAVSRGIQALNNCATSPVPCDAATMANINTAVARASAACPPI